jgi:hypothetical protein
VGKIFINYRRGSDAGFAQALYQHLESEFAIDDLFMDVEGHIKPGDDFIEVLNAQVAACDVFLAVIGPRWTRLLTARKGDPRDFVAIEIEAALNQGKRVIPVLVDSALMPRADKLPEKIRPLVTRNAIGLRPERFKADCQSLIAALKESLAAAEKARDAIQRYSCFIIYSTKDDEFAHRIHADLQNSGVRCWFAAQDLPIGEKIRDAIDAAIRLRDKVVLILSEHSINSGWVGCEVEAAFEEEDRLGRIVLVPVRLDDTVMTTNEAWASKLRARLIGDFTRWKDHDAYKQSFERVLRDLTVPSAK